MADDTTDGPLILTAAVEEDPPEPVKFGDHPRRQELVNELHARPFPALNMPCHAAFLAIKNPVDAANRDIELDRAHLLELLDHYAAAHPEPGANHYYGTIGRFRLKWERHTEFVTYTLFNDGLPRQAFESDIFGAFPKPWLDRAPGTRLSSALIRVELQPVDTDAVERKLAQWFVPESLASSQVADSSAVVAGDYRIDGNGHMRFAVFAKKDTTPRRIGRIVQRLCEIEVYKTMSLLALPRSRDLSKRLAKLDIEVSDLVRHVKSDERPATELLDELLGISADLENLMAQNSFRFSATNAYATIVKDRILALRENRIEGRQTFREFMRRRYDPAIRSINAAMTHLEHMAERTKRAGDLLRTKVEVARSEQNQDLLFSMDKRADLQLRLQKTVEGLSVVAISYYAVNLATYVLAPLTKGVGLGKTGLLAIVTPLVVLAVWAVVRRIRKTVH